MKQLFILPVIVLMSFACYSQDISELKKENERLKAQVDSLRIAAEHMKMIAELNAGEALKQQGIAVQNAEEAQRQAEIAEQNAKEAKRQQEFAVLSAKEAQRQMEIAALMKEETAQKLNECENKVNELEKKDQ